MPGRRYSCGTPSPWPGTGQGFEPPSLSLDLLRSLDVAASGEPLGRLLLRRSAYGHVYSLLSFQSSAFEKTRRRTHPFLTRPRIVPTTHAKSFNPFVIKTGMLRVLRQRFGYAGLASFYSLQSSFLSSTPLQT